MSGPTQVLTGWRGQVAIWFQVVEQHRAWSGLPYPAVAAQYKQNFPRNLVLRIVSQLSRSLAMWVVKGAISDAAAAMGLSLDPAIVGGLADLAVAFL